LSAKRDENEKEIVSALRSEGYAVFRLSGPGIPDLLVVKPDKDAPVYVCDTVAQALNCAGKAALSLIEVKMPGGTLTESQQAFFTVCRDP
jgi:hypothetical protein